MAGQIPFPDAGLNAIDPMKIRGIEKDVDPVLDAERTAAMIKDLQAKSKR